MQTISVSVPTGMSPRPAVARQTMQNALNRSIPALSQDDRTEYALYKTSPAPTSARHAMRPIASGASFVTNEFSPRSRAGPSRIGAKTNVVDVGGRIFVHPTERLHVRGVSGFFPPLKIKGGDGGSMRQRCTASAPASLTRHTCTQDYSSASSTTTSHTPTTHSKSLNVELAPSSSTKITSPRTSSRDGTSPQNKSPVNSKKSPKEEWPKCSSSKKTNDSPVVFQNDTYNLSVPRKEAVGDMRVTRENGHVTSLSNASKYGFSSSNRDTPFIRAFKLKQKRQHKFKEIMDSNYRSPTVNDFGHVHMS